MAIASLNFRDLGGLAATGGHTRKGVLYRSEGPRNFAPGHQAALQAIGPATVALAGAENLPGHAQSVAARLRKT